MAAKIVLLFCAHALLIQSIVSQYIGGGCNSAANAMAWEAAAATPCGAAWNSGLGAPWSAGPMASSYVNPEWAAGYSAASLAASNGGGLVINSVSPLTPTGVSMTSENVYEGPLSIIGSLPYLGAVAVEGTMPTVGAGAVAYGCGNGNVAMLSEDISPLGQNGFAGAYGYGPGAAVGSGYGYGPGAVLESGYGYGSPLAYEAGTAGPAYGAYGYRGCGTI